VAGRPLLAYALSTASSTTCGARVLVATDDPEIAAVAGGLGAEVVMTAPALASGSDRVWAALGRAHPPVEPGGIVVNLQCDEPLLPGWVLDRLVDRLSGDRAADVATPVVAVLRARAAPDDVVTVARDDDGTARYFSRSVVPWGAPTVWQHLGVYAYRHEALGRYVAAAPTTLETTERLEQLRALSLGLTIAAVEVDVSVHAVDRPEDVAAVESLLAAGRP
jgi:3-deoxy-manno-octulosonate cytidylyltransferase (CMP-KDO synthetase)